MQRVILASLLSFLAGAGASYLFLSGSDDSRSDLIRAAAPVTPPAATSGTGVGDSSAAAPPAVAERARVYQAVAEASADELRAMALDALASDDRTAAGFELDAGLARLVEIDPDMALAFARDHELGPQQTLDVALGVLNAIGVDRRTIDDVLAALPQLDRDQFGLRAVQRLAATDPAAALRIAVDDLADGGMVSPAFGPAQGIGMPMLLAIGASWATTDPNTAVAAIDSIANPQARRMFAQAVIGELARSDPDRALAFVDAMNPRGPEKMILTQSVIAQMAQQDPQRALEQAESLGGQAGQFATMAALMQLAERDIAAAIGYVEAMPAGTNRQNFVQRLAMSYGRQNPDAALAWARSLQFGSAEAYAGVLAGLASADPERALALAFDDPSPGLPPELRMTSLMNVINMTAGNGLVRFEPIADRILTVDNPQLRQQAMQILVGNWATNDADAALAWFMNNQQWVGRDVLTTLASQLGNIDPASAALYSNRVRQDMRTDWITALAEGYARRDPSGARAWVQQFRGEPVYERIVGIMVQSQAGSDPPGAAALWETLDPSNSPGQAQLATVIAGGWAARDWAAARNWVQSLPRNEARDGALAALIRSRREAPDPSLMSLFSSDEKRLGAIRDMISPMAVFDPAEARRLVDQYVHDPSRHGEMSRVIDDIEARQKSPGPGRPGPMTGGFNTAIGIREGIVN